VSGGGSSITHEESENFRSSFLPDQRKKGVRRRAADEEDRKKRENKENQRLNKGREGKGSLREDGYCRRITVSM